MPLTEYDAASGSATQDPHEDAPVPLEHFAHIDLAHVVASATNPRTTFDAEKLQQLADSIRASGVHQPILVRRLPSSRLSDTAHLSPRPTHEIVSGERRFRASKIAGQQSIPAMVRALSDVQVLEIQLIENLQRDDLTPLEEAAGYARLVAGTSITKEQIGERIGRSRGYVYGRLKLMDLCQEGQKALRDGKIEATVAEKIARIPGHKLQIKALEYAKDTDWQGKPAHSYQDVKKWIDTELMRTLSKARFPIASADLVPLAGACSACPKRTGAEPDLFADVKGPDVCTDPTCFQQKEDAHAATLVQAAKEKGQTVIAGKEAQELVTDGYVKKLKGYKRLDDAADSPTDKPLRKIIGAQMKAEGITPVMIEHHQRKGELVAALPNDVVARLLKAVEGQAQAAKVVAKEAKAFADEKKAKAEEKAKGRYEQGWRDQLLARTWSKLKDGSVAAFTLAVHRHLAQQAVRNLATAEVDALCKLLELGPVGGHSALVDFANTTPSPDLLQLLIIMQRDAGVHDFTYIGGGERVNNLGLMLIAGIVHGDGLAKAITEAQADAAAKFLPAPEPVPPAKPAGTRTARYHGPCGETWSGRGLMPKWLKVLIDDGRALEEFDTSAPAPTEGPAAPSPHTRAGKGPSGKRPAAQATNTPAPRRKMTAQEASAGIAAAMQDLEAAAPAAADAPGAVEPSAPAAEGDDPGSAPALPGDEASALADADASTATDETEASVIARATELVIREQRATVRLLKTELSIGTTLAMQVMKQLEFDGTVSAASERGVRMVLVQVDASHGGPR